MKNNIFVSTDEANAKIKKLEQKASYRNKCRCGVCRDCLTNNYNRQMATFDLRDYKETHAWVGLGGDVWHSYHSHNVDEFKSTKLRLSREDKPLYFGFEFEFLSDERICDDWDGYNEEWGVDKRRDIIKEMVRISGGLLQGEQDGSLDDEDDRNVGIEFTTRPMSVGVIKDKEVRRRLQNALDYGREHGLYITDKCGGHIHIDKSYFNKTNKKTGEVYCGWEQSARNITYLFKEMQEELEELSGRSYGYYCQVPNNNSYDMNNLIKRAKELGVSTLTMKNLPYHSGDHYTAVNTDSFTIEIRTFQTTDSVDELLARVEFLETICKIARDDNNFGGMTLKDIVYSGDKPNLQARFEQIEKKYKQHKKQFKAVAKEFVVNV